MKLRKIRYNFFRIVAVLLIISSPVMDLSAQLLRTKTPVPVIFDTDIGPDYDDVGATAILHALTDKKEAEILAIMSSNQHELVVPCIDVLNTWFRRPAIPIAAPKGKAVNMDGWQKWADTLVARYPHRIRYTSQAPDAVKLYRKILSTSRDTSIVIVSVGFLTNLANLLRSESDEFSIMSGKELVRKKVRYWVAMAGKFPEGKEFNIRVDSTASQYTIDQWPTAIIFSGFEIGEKIFTGLNLIKKASKGNPVAGVFRICIGKDGSDMNGRQSWDQTAVLIAIRGYERYFDVERGIFITAADGTNGWKADDNGKHYRLLFKMPVPELTKEIEELMMHEP